MILPPAIATPPARYAWASMEASVSFLPQDEVHRVCAAAQHPPKTVILACSVPGAPGSPCIVILPTPRSWSGTGDAYRDLVDHELGHCAGWPANHPRR